MWRKNPVTLTIASVWLAVMLLATLPGGGHYFVDLLAGFAVWAAWFSLSRMVERRMAQGRLA
jgi:membrane-associated phospholipid phosphatase